MVSLHAAVAPILTNEQKLSLTYEFDSPLSACCGDCAMNIMHKAQPVS